MTPLSFHQAQALAGLMRDRDAQTAIVIAVNDNILATTLFDDSNTVLGTGAILADGRVREHARS